MADIKVYAYQSNAIITTELKSNDTSRSTISSSWYYTDVYNERNLIGRLARPMKLVD